MDFRSFAFVRVNTSAGIDGKFVFYLQLYNMRFLSSSFSL